MEQSDFSIDGGYAAAGRLLVRVPDIEGIFCATDSIAIGAKKRLEEQGKHIPDDVALAGIGHSRHERGWCGRDWRLRTIITRPAARKRRTTFLRSLGRA